MKTLILAFTLALATPAAAQFLSPLPQTSFAIPQTIKLHDANGKVVGTGALTGRRLIMRDNNNELIGSVVFEQGGKKTLYDPSGKQVDTLSIAGPPIKLPDEP